MNVPRTPRLRGTAWAAVTLAAVLGGSAAVLPQSAAASPASSASPGQARVDAAVLDAVSAGQKSRFFVVLKDQADLSAAKRAKGHGARAKTAFEALRTEAADSQKPLRAFLDRKKVGYESYWIANTLLVTTDDKAVVEELAGRADVASIVKERTYRLDGVEAASRDTGNSGRRVAGPDWWSPTSQAVTPRPARSKAVVAVVASSPRTGRARSFPLAGTASSRNHCPARKSATAHGSLVVSSHRPP